MTLKQWLDYTGTAPLSSDTPAVVIHSANEQRKEWYLLWQLDDYIVDTVAAGTIRLIPRPVEQPQPSTPAPSTAPPSTAPPSAPPPAVSIEQGAVLTSPVTSQLQADKTRCGDCENCRIINDKEG